MIEWTADPRREPSFVQVTWTDACMDASFSCALSDVGQKAMLQHGRRSDGRLVYIRADGRDARVVLASLYDAPGVADEAAWVENFMIIPLGWVEKIKLIRGGTIYTRDQIPPYARATRRKRVRE